MGKTYYAKPYGNDSSNIYAVLGPPAYWKRVYYRPDLERQFLEEDAKRQKSKPSGASSSHGAPQEGSGLQQSASDSALPVTG